MTRRTLITAGLVAAAISVAFSIHPQTWFAKDTPASASVRANIGFGRATLMIHAEPKHDRCCEQHPVRNSIGAGV